MRLLWEMATEAGDESLTRRDRGGPAAALPNALEAFEVKVVLSGPQDRKNAILSIHPGAGGTESQDWAQMLMRMYLRWAERRRASRPRSWTCSPGEEAGIKSATIEITGEYAYGYLKGEIGVHRLIRISPFDASKRRHTSFASVAVIPEVEDVEVVVKDEELRVDVYRSSGPGGQGVNTADSAVRITHLPSGHRGRLPERALPAPEPRHRHAHPPRRACTRSTRRSRRRSSAELTGEKKEIAFGSQIRTYTFHPYQIIKDHRTGRRDRQCRRGDGRGDRAVHRGVPRRGGNRR